MGNDDEQTIDLSSVAVEEPLINALLDRRAYPHAIQDIRLIETHVSWVILTGQFAYKIKKPLKLEFLDYSSLDRRRHFCEEELRLNTRWAPSLYLDVVAIGGTFENPQVGGNGEPIEYALRMHQFLQSAQLDEQLSTGRLSDADMMDLAEMIAEQHDASGVCDRIGAADACRLIREPMLENIRHLQSFIDADDHGALDRWTQESLEDLWPTLLQRQDAGFTRECHGDLKLTNLVRLRSGIVAFDCVEFNAELRNIDVISDISFLAMDLVARGRADLAYVFLNRYLERTGDYAGMATFSLYFVYHALILAKTSAIRSIERGDDREAGRDKDVMNHYVSVARARTRTVRPLLIAMHGFSGSGKTHLSQRLLKRLPAIRVRSDIERKRSHGLAETEDSGAGVGTGIYEPQARHKIYAQLATLATVLVRSFQHVIVDASFLHRADRNRLRELAAQQGAGFIIVNLVAGRDDLERRLQNRPGGASEADADVLRYQYEHAEPLDDNESEFAVTVDTSAAVDADAIADEIRRAVSD